LGVQLITPLALMLEIGRASSRERVKTLAGRSPSVAVLVTVSVVSSLIVRLVWPVSTGALFTSLTVTVKELVALRAGAPLSVTMVVNVFVLGPCASLGVQLITPLALMLAPVGGDTN